MLRFLAVLVAVATCLGCARQTLETPVSDGTSDAAAIYGAFLDRWTGKDKDVLNVAITARSPTADEVKEFADCTDKVHWTTAEPIADLSDVIGHMAYVRLTDANTWAPRDPADLMAEGQSVESAVASAFGHGLMTLSAISYDESRTMAAFNYSFVCGALCGSGGPVVFERTTSGWVEIDAQCVSWIS